MRHAPEQALFEADFGPAAETGRSDDDVGVGARGSGRSGRLCRTPHRSRAPPWRGATINPGGRYEAQQRVSDDDGWGSLGDLAPFKTEVAVEKPRTIITKNDSPDISFDRSINPYRGCEHGCVYCFARPSHAYLGLSPGLDFESKLTAKPDAALLLEKELSAASYQPRTIAIGTNTDAYQPIEKKLRIMRQILEVLAKFNHPVGIVTKSALVQRDIDILAPMAAKGWPRSRSR